MRGAPDGLYVRARSALSPGQTQILANLQFKWGVALGPRVVGDGSGRAGTRCWLLFATGQPAKRSHF
jgi:hypothetical protein